MAKKIFNCIVCGKRPLTKNEIGITKKILGIKSKNFFCVDCLANFLDVELQDILDKIEDFKHDGCKLFE